MYRLLIVDDEPVIVNGLIQLFQENTEFELDVCKAYSAVEALNIAKKMKLDILVSDIRMPQKSGLQLVDDIAYYWPHCRIIFLTGYSEFDYVQEALRKRADNYILKTEGIEPIFGAVKAACQKLDEENRRRIREEKAKMHFQIAAPVLKNELVGRLLKGESAAALLSDPRYEELDFRIRVSSLHVLSSAAWIQSTIRIRRTSSGRCKTASATICPIRLHANIPCWMKASSFGCFSRTKNCLLVFPSRIRSRSGGGDLRHI
ncbi:putative response regulatory protein [Paenibacillus sp. P1XP2]|nr:putative response regulatory protein [Paenibacillus sp. P1XP2]